MTITGDTSPKLLSPSEAAQILRVSKSTMYRLLSSGALPAFKVRGQIRISIAELEDYLFEKGTP